MAKWEAKTGLATAKMSKAADAYCATNPPVITLVIRAICVDPDTWYSLSVLQDVALLSA